MDVVRALRAFTGLPSVTIEASATAAAALDLSDKGMDFADPLHLEGPVHCEGFVTFDRKFVETARAAGCNNVHEA